MALRLGHRHSLDFDFFSPAHFDPQDLLLSLGFLAGAEVAQASRNTLTAITETGRVHVSFFGGLDHLQAVFPADRADNGISVASLGDIFANKCLSV